MSDRVKETLAFVDLISAWLKPEGLASQGALVDA